MGVPCNRHREIRSMCKGPEDRARAGPGRLMHRECGRVSGSLLAQEFTFVLSTAGAQQDPGWEVL